jgi:hypothetical protein
LAREVALKRNISAGLVCAFIPANVLSEGVARAGSKAVFFFRST